MTSNVRNGLFYRNDLFDMNIKYSNVVRTYLLLCLYLYNIHYVNIIIINYSYIPYMKTAGIADIRRRFIFLLTYSYSLNFIPNPSNCGCEKTLYAIIYRVSLQYFTIG